MNLFAHIVNPSLNTAQFFFLCAAIVGVICVVFGFAPFGRPYPWALAALIMVVLVLLSIGLLFSGAVGA
jgi:hypothetical protein